MAIVSAFSIGSAGVRASLHATVTAYRSLDTDLGLAEDRARRVLCPPLPPPHDDTSILRAQLRGLALQQTETQRMLRATLTSMGMGVPSGGDGVVMERRKGVKSEELEL